MRAPRPLDPRLLHGSYLPAVFGRIDTKLIGQLNHSSIQSVLASSVSRKQSPTWDCTTSPKFQDAPVVSAAPAAPTGLAAPAAPTGLAAPAAPTGLAAPAAHVAPASSAAPVVSAAPAAPSVSSIESRFLLLTYLRIIRILVIHQIQMNCIYVMSIIPSC